MKRQILDEVVAAREAKRPLVLVTDITSGEQSIFDPADRANPLGEELQRACSAALDADRGATLEVDGVKYFLHPFNPALRMIVVGAVHITQALAPMAALSGYDVTVVDPRRAFASSERFPGISVLTDWPDDALNALGIDARTAVVTLTHDPKLDDPALEVALRSSAFYIGSLGSKKTHAARLERLSKLGLDEIGRSRICGPIGLAIGAKSPAEIAISIMAQVTETLRTSVAKPVPAAVA